MKLTLKELPDAKFIAQNPGKFLTVGNEYEVVREIGNGVVVKDNQGEALIVCRIRFH